MMESLMIYGLTGYEAKHSWALSAKLKLIPRFAGLVRMKFVIVGRKSPLAPL
jgi:hypothetical protein